MAGLVRPLQTVDCLHPGLRVGAPGAETPVNLARRLCKTLRGPPWKSPPFGS
jgi:hypothetical protein